MPEKTIRQQPVTIEHVKQVMFVLFGTGIDGVTSYQPVDETDTVIGEVRSYTEHFTGPNAARIRDFLAVEIVPDLNEYEGTGNGTASTTERVRDFFTKKGDT